MVKRFLTAAIAATMILGATSVFGAPPGYDAVEVKDGGTIKGRVVFGGDAPERKKLEVTKDHEACGKDAKLSDELTVNAENKGIQWAVVYVKKIKKGKAWPEGSMKQTYDQKACVFTEHVKVIPVGCTLEMSNSDAVLHNVKAASMKTNFNESIPANDKIEQTFNFDEQVKLECSVHPWMSSYLFVSEHPYAVVTDADGNFELTDLPKGKYNIIAWQETLGKHDKKGEKVEIKGGDTQELELKFEGK